MISVKPQPKPAKFDEKVGKPGRAWLRKNPGETKFEPYWTKCLPELRQAYKGICAYFCCYVRPGTGASSVDHFFPKSLQRDKAYQWSNYRFACSRMNGRKGAAGLPLDPFKVQDGWFELDFPSMQVRPAAGLKAAYRWRVRAVIDRLGLNAFEPRQEREEHWDNYYVRRHITIEYLIEYASPFVAMEACRQGLLHPQDRHVTIASIRAWLDA